MSFTKKKINSIIIWVIDIWSYKIRVWICKIIKNNIKLIWYWEKRQDEKYIFMQEIQSLEWITQNINDAIKKAEKDAWITVNNVIINSPSLNLFSTFLKVNYIRKNNNKKIDQNELYDIIEYIETIALKDHYNYIKKYFWYKKHDLKILISNISKIKIDSYNISKLLYSTWKNINISILNISTTRNTYDILNILEKSINKNIKNIVPSEYALTFLFKKTTNLIIIDIWNLYTSVIVKENGNIKWIKKLLFWINDLIKEIRKNYKLTKNDIIESIDLDRFKNEKKEFLILFKDILVISLEDILWTNIFPNKFFITWWWSNVFIKEYIKNLNINNSNLNIIWKIQLLSPEIEWFNELENKNLNKSNINIFSMIKSLDVFSKDNKDNLIKLLKEVIWKIEN